MPIAELVLQVRMAVKDHQGTLPFQIPHETRYTHLRRDRHQHMHVVDLGIPLDDFHPFPFAQILQYHHDTLFVLVVDHFPTLLGREHNMVLTHPFCVC